jgi:hypothetical protein
VELKRYLVLGNNPNFNLEDLGDQDNLQTVTWEIKSSTPPADKIFEGALVVKIKEDIAGLELVETV